ncbi:hypothetical protein AB5I41_13040 [Sphingomonas sp. MMS24-JH45]
MQAVNLTDATTRARSVINADGLTAPRSYFRRRSPLHADDPAVQL